LPPLNIVASFIPCFYRYIKLFSCFAAHSAVVLKAESIADKVEWVNKIKAVIQSKGGSFKGPDTEGGPMKQSQPDGSVVSSRLCTVDLPF
jgi:hypothetical protein